MLLDSLLRHFKAAPEVATPSDFGELGKDFLTSRIVAMDRMSDDTRTRGREDYVHVSNLIKFCSRRHVLSVKDNIQQVKAPRSADRIVWEMGRAAERHVRNQLIQSLEYRGVVGNWRCYCEQLDYGGFYVAERVCARCNSPASNYHEFVLFDDDARIVGHPDLMLLFRDSLLVAEVKSINKKDFEALKDDAKPNHIFQGSAYHRLMSLRKTVPVLPVIAILYAAKDYIFKGLPYKEFYVDVTKGQHQSVLDLAWANAHKVKEALRDDFLPARISACPNSQSTTAKGCAACNSCFSRHK